MNVVTMLYYAGIRDEIRMSENERVGIVYIEEIRSLIQYTQQHRGLSGGLLSGDKTIEPIIQAKYNEVNQVYERIETLLKTHNLSPTLKNDFHNIFEEWNTLTTNLRSYDAPTAISAHTNLISNIFDFAATIAGESQLFLDKELVNYHMVVLMVEKLPMITELMGQSRALGTSVAAKGNKTGNEEFRIMQLKHALERQVHDAERSFQAIYREDQLLEAELAEMSIRAISDVSRLISILDTEFLNKSSVTINSLDYFNFTTEAIDGYFNFINHTSQLLDDRLADRIAKDKLVGLVVFILITITMGLILFFFIILYFAIRETINEIQVATSRIAEGDLSQDVVINTKDEMKSIAVSLNHMISSMKQLLQSNQFVSQELAASSEELAMVTEETAKSTEQVTHSIEEITKAIEEQLVTSKETEKAVDELARGLEVVVRNSNEVVGFATDTTKEAEKGEELVTNTIDQMEIISQSISETFTIIEQLNDKSKSIGEIINVITNIADQTNLLALNAAIEAARAGEQGRGFSVVADEVRKLAEQSASSAKNINDLIQDVQVDTDKARKAMEKVITDANAGVTVVNLTGAGFEKILTSTKDVQGKITEVANLAVNMDQYIAQLVKNVTDNATIAAESEVSAHSIASSSQEQLAAMEEIASAVTTLNTRAQDLQIAIEKFKV